MCMEENCVIFTHPHVFPNLYVKIGVILVLFIVNLFNYILFNIISFNFYLFGILLSAFVM